MSNELNRANDALVRLGKLSESEFIPSNPERLENIIPIVRAALSTFNSVKLEYLGDVQGRWLQHFANDAHGIHHKLEQLKKHKDDSDFTKYVTELKEELRGAIEHNHHILAYSNCRNDNYAETQTRVKMALQEHLGQMNELEIRVKDIEDRARKVLAKLEEVSLTKAVTQQAGFFQNEIDRHKDLAANWLENTRYALGALILAALLSFVLHLVYDSKDTFTSVQLVVSKVLLIGVLTYITVQCAKNYYAHCHLREMNQHRRNAILSYEDFLNASTELEVRAAIVSYVAAAVFTPQESGFVSSPITFEAPKNLPELVVKTTTAATGIGGH